MSGRRGFVYLLHFDGRINPDHPCRHYVGFTDDLRERIAQHAAGGSTAARLLQVAKERGICFTVARVWRGDRGLERRIKRQKHTPAYCPVCGGRRWIDYADELAPAEIGRLTGAPVLCAVFPVAFLAQSGGGGIVVNGATLAIALIVGLIMALALREFIAALRGRGGDRMG